MRKNPNFDILVSVWFMTAASERRGEGRHEERQKQRRIWYAWCSICETFCCCFCRDSTAIGTNFARVYVFASCFSINRCDSKISCIYKTQARWRDYNLKKKKAWENDACIFLLIIESWKFVSLKFRFNTNNLRNLLWLNNFNLKTRWRLQIFQIQHFLV